MRKFIIKPLKESANVHPSEGRKGKRTRFTESVEKRLV